MSASPHKLILASAGTGKTYQLSGRYLALLLRGVPPERILATTFTRKAAGEILERVLRRLAEAAEDPARLEELNAQLAQEGQVAVSRERCVALLAELAGGLDRLRIRTLDAFFAQLAGVFALELGLPPGWRILEQDEQRALEREALGEALSRAERDEVLELLRALQQAPAARGVESQLLSTVAECRHAYLDSSEAAWDQVNVPEGLGEERLEEVLTAIEVMALPTDERWSRARDKLLRQARAGDWEKVLGTGLLAKVLAGDEQYYKKDITDAHREALLPLVDQAACVLLTELRRRNLASHAWLGRFERSLVARKEAVSGMAFEDVPRALAPTDGGLHAARDLDLGYRLDGSVDHLLLDEFQDTAPSQWKVLRPLAEEIIAEGDGEKTFFCVGDVKQSIYAWRSGEPRLLEQMNKRQPALPPSTPLVENWRSSPVVLNAVDRIFENIGRSTAFSGQEAYRSAAVAFQKNYAPHISARQDLPGAVNLIEAQPFSSGHRDLPVLHKAAARAADLARQAPHATIALLLRRNAHAPLLIELLRRHGLRASGEGGSPLVNSAAVQATLSAFQLADHPDDSAAAFHLVTSPLAAAFGADGVDYADGASRVDLSRDLRARLARVGFGELLEQLLPAVESHASLGAWDALRFSQLVDLGFQFDRREALRPGAFGDYVRSTTVEAPSADQVKVMTVHRAKGLEFDAVILPELDISMILVPPKILRRRPVPDEPLAGVSVSASGLVSALDPEGLGLIHHEAHERQVQESLCQFYVAMTRAAHRLELIVRAPGQRTETLSCATVLREALDVGDTGEHGLIWSHPDSADAWWPEPPSGDPPAPAPALRVPSFSASATPRDLPRRSPSSEEGGGKLAVGDLLAPRVGGPLTRGSLIHRFMEEVVWLEDFDLDDAALDALGQSIQPDPDARAEALSAFRAALEQPELKALFSRPDLAPEETVEVWNERDFSEVLEQDGERRLWTGTFDRVVLVRAADGSPIRAEVIDHKTDRVTPETLEERVEHYRPQLAGYRQVLSRMTGLAPERIETTIAFLGPGIAKRLGSD